MPLMRRRPLMRAALVGGGAYAAGKHRQRSQQAEQDQNAEIADLQEQQAAPQQAYAPPAPAPAPAAAVDSQFEALTKLKQLLDAEVLTQAEFDAQKQKILAGG